MYSAHEKLFRPEGSRLAGAPGMKRRQSHPTHGCHLHRRPRFYAWFVETGLTLIPDCDSPAEAGNVTTPRSINRRTLPSDVEPRHPGTGESGLFTESPKEQPGGACCSVRGTAQVRLRSAS